MDRVRKRAETEGESEGEERQRDGTVYDGGRGMSAVAAAPHESRQISHIYHTYIYNKRSVSTWQTVAIIALSRLANPLLPSGKGTGY